MSARNPLIVRADICGFSARSSAEKVKFSVSCTVGRNELMHTYKKLVQLFCMYAHIQSCLVTCLHHTLHTVFTHVIKASEWQSVT